MADIGIGDWTGRRVLVTGHSGFVGSWVSVALVQLGSEVVGYSASSDPDTAERAKWLTELGAREITGDIRDLDGVLGAMRSAKPETVIHLAAQPLVSVGWADPYATLDTNIGGSLAVLEAARISRPQSLLHVTSDKCYRALGRNRGYREDDSLGGGCPYSVSKAAAELVFEGYNELFAALPEGPRAVSIRFGNVIGGGDFAVNRLVPDCLRALAEQRPAELRDPTAVRPFQHVLDVVHGLLRADAALRGGTVPPGDVLNFAPPEGGIRVALLASALTEAWGAPPWRPATGPAFTEDAQLQLDGRKAQRLLGWRHRYDIDSSARAIVDWHRRLLDGSSAAECTSDDVETFLRDLSKEAA